MGKPEGAGRRQRQWQYFLDGYGDSLSEFFARRTGVDPHRDDRVRDAADPDRHEKEPTPAPRRGRKQKREFNACVLALTALVDELQGHPAEHDWQTITVAMIWPGGWGPNGEYDGEHRVPFSSDRDIRRRQIEHLCVLVKKAYYRGKGPPPHGSN